MRNLNTIQLLMTVFLIAIASSARAQDRIITVTGSTLHGHVKKVGKDEITFRKYFKKYKIPAKKVLYVEYENGKRTQVNDITLARHYKNFSMLAYNSPGFKTDSIKKLNPTVQFKPHYIERIGNNFRLDTNQIINTRELNNILSQSPNPLVAMNLKAAKTMRTFCTLSKISSYPGSAGGAFATFKTCQTMLDQLKQGPAPFKTYLGVGLSFVGTLTLPITSAILKNIQRKLYDKTLLTYSMGY
jgi:hypothetical protein